MGTQSRFKRGKAATDNPCGPGQHAVTKVRLAALSTKGCDPPGIAFRTGTRAQPVYIPVSS